MRSCAVALVAACASPQPPPGGPPDTAAPHLVSTKPDSGQVRVRIDEVEFRFDEVVGETMRGGGLDRAVLVSPSDGRVSVDWKRDAITVKPNGGWRPNTTYVVTLLPGLVDLRGNARDTATVLVFSTGDSLVSTRITGTVFDWNRAVAAARALVVAHLASDSTVRSTTEADSLGRFTLPFLSPGDYVVRGIVDANRNQRVDPRELWDSVLVTLRDSAAIELYSAVRDSVFPRAVSVSAPDSLTLRLTLDRPLSPDTSIAPRIEVFGPDSAVIAVQRVVPWPALAELRARAQRARQDSLDANDTTEAVRARLRRAREDSATAAAIRADSVARGLVRREQGPQSRRPALVSELGIVFARPLAPGTMYRVRITATGLRGLSGTSERNVTTARPAAGSDR